MTLLCEYEKAVCFRRSPGQQLRLGRGFWVWRPLIHRALLSWMVTQLLAVVATELGALLVVLHAWSHLEGVAF